MSYTVRQASQPEYSWIANKAKIAVGPEFRAICAVDGERIVGMVGFDGWTDNLVCVHIALEAPGALRALLKMAFGIAFRQTGRKIVGCTVVSSNDRSTRLVKHLGFREVFRGRNYWADGVDVVWYEMTAEECRWI